jgi:hypothetical protein
VDKVYENFPIRLVILCNLVTISIYILGAYILAGFGVWAAMLYLLYCLWLEFRVLKISCVNCYYYGKICGSGKGRLGALLFKQGDPQRFAELEISWVEMLPDFLVSIVPALGGIILLVRNFNWLLVVMLALLLLLTFGGNAIVRGSFMCKYCRQKEIGCPAAKLFGVEGSNGN